MQKQVQELNKKLCITLPPDLVVKVDNYSEIMNITRTSAICILLNKGLEFEKKDN